MIDNKNPLPLTITMPLKRKKGRVRAGRTKNTRCWKVRLYYPPEETAGLKVVLSDAMMNS